MLKAKSSENVSVWNEEFLLMICRQTLAAHLRVADDAIDAGKHFDEMGMDSIDGVLLSGALSERLNSDLAPELFLQHRTINDVVRHLLEISGETRSEAPPARVDVFYFSGGAGRENTASRLVACSGARLFLQTPPLGEWPEWIDDGCDLSGPIQRCCDWIEARCPSGGLRLAGHSLGGQIAFAVALNLLESGRDVDGLFLFDSWALPKQMLGLMAWGLRRLKNGASRALGGRPLTSAEAADPADYGRMHVAMKVLDLKLGRVIFRWFSNLQPQRPPNRRRIEVNNAIRMKLLDVMWRRWSASLSPGQAAGLPVTLFRAQSPGLPDLGWSTFCRNLKVIEANGDHVSMLEYPYVQDIVDNLMNVLPIAAVVRVDATSSARRASEGKGVESFQPDP